MPLHAQIACIGGNAVFALLFLIAAQDTSDGAPGISVLMVALAGAAVYTCWVLIKFRRYLSIEAARDRELHIEKLLLEIEALKAKAGDQPPGA